MRQSAIRTVANRRKQRPPKRIQRTSATKAKHASPKKAHRTHPTKAKRFGVDPGGLAALSRPQAASREAMMRGIGMPVQWPHLAN